eukprot:COSAG06_NODE_37259_length_437_cov_0.920118_2_plen_31_part_01
MSDTDAHVARSPRRGGRKAEMAAAAAAAAEA